MNYKVYILYSTSGVKYYTGYTQLTIEERLRRHLSNHRGFTGKYDDWIVVFVQEMEDKSTALKLEKKIKKRGAKRFILDQDIRVTPKA